jgi:hypothetical protein
MNNFGVLTFGKRSLDHGLMVKSWVAMEKKMR